MEVKAFVALSAGFLSFFSPCLLPMVPAYILYISGSDVLASEREQKKRAFMRTLSFVLGFTIIFMIMGTSAGVIGKIFLAHRVLFMRISGVLIILFGLNMLGIFTPAILGKERQKKPVKITSWFSAFMMGVAFAGAWTPCFGPVLGGILLYVANEATASYGMWMLFIYSLGMAIPFLLTALFVSTFDKFLQKQEKFLAILPKISGICLIFFGILIFTNKITDISSLLI